MAQEVSSYRPAALPSHTACLPHFWTPDLSLSHVQLLPNTIPLQLSTLAAGCVRPKLITRNVTDRQTDSTKLLSLVHDVAQRQLISMCASSEYIRQDDHSYSSHGDRSLLANNRHDAPSFASFQGTDSGRHLFAYGSWLPCHFLSDP